METKERLKKALDSIKLKTAASEIEAVMSEPH
jgi:hypothetical protein